MVKQEWSKDGVLIRPEWKGRSTEDERAEIGLRTEEERTEKERSKDGERREQ